MMELDIYPTQAIAQNKSLPRTQTFNNLNDAVLNSELSALNTRIKATNNLLNSLVKSYSTSNGDEKLAEQINETTQYLNILLIKREDLNQQLTARENKVFNAYQPRDDSDDSGYENDTEVASPREQSPAYVPRQPLLSDITSDDDDEMPKKEALSENLVPVNTDAAEPKKVTWSWEWSTLTYVKNSASQKRPLYAEAAPATEIEPIEASFNLSREQMLTSFLTKHNATQDKEAKILDKLNHANKTTPTLPEIDHEQPKSEKPKKKFGCGKGQCSLL